MGEREYEFRKSLADPKSNAQERKHAFEILEQIQLVLIGYLAAISDISGDSSKAEYYKKFYDQARSANGIQKRV